MTETAIRRPELALVLALFPEQSLTIRKLFLRNESFRGLSEDYALARAALARFEALPDAGQRPEVPEYRAVIRELETEIAVMLSDPPDTPPSSMSRHQNHTTQRRPE